MEHDRIDIRSDKVRRLLDERPPSVVRYGTVALVVVFAVVGIVIAWWFGI
ncbi:MAG: hypothetical protein NC127_06700 [Muribaculum sp.]|nr:hypothetical protein [Muribaculum sp.]